MKSLNSRYLLALGVVALLEGSPPAFSAEGDSSAGAVWLAEKRTLHRFSPSGEKLLSVPTVEDNSSLAVDPRSGAVWAGEKRSLSKYAFDGSLVLRRELDAEGDGRVLVAMDPEGRPWAAAGRFLIALQPDGSERFRTTIAEEAEAVAYNARTRRLWLATEHEVLLFSDEGALIESLVAGDLGDVSFATDSNRGTTWVAFQKVLVRYDELNREELRVNLARNTRDLAVEPRSGGIWVSDHFDVVLLSPAGQATVRARPFGSNGEGDRQPRHLAVESQTGSLWVASKKQLATVDNAGTVRQLGSGLEDVRDLASFADLLPPKLEVVFPPANGLIATDAPTIQLRYSDVGSGVEAASLVVMVDGQNVTPTCAPVEGGSDCVFSGQLSLADGVHSLDAQVADRAGNEAEASVSFTVDTIPPAPPDPSDVEISLAEEGGSWEVAGGPGSVEGGSTVLVRNTRTGEVVSVIANPDGSFSARISADPGDVLEITVQDAAGNVSGPVRVTVSPMPPETAGSGFIHGLVRDARTGQPLVNVSVTARGVTGRALTDGAGRFVLPTPGTGAFALFFEKHSYITARRDQYVLAQRHATVGEVGLLAYDPTSVLVTPAGGTVADSSGKVQAIFPPGAVSQAITVSATYFGKEAEFPLPLPEGTVFVAGVQMTPEHTSFLQPVTLRFANELGFAPGTSIPFAFASHDEEDPSEGFYDPGMATVTADGAFVEAQVTHFSCVTLGVAPPPGTNEGEECPACNEVPEVEDPELKCDVSGTSSVCITDGNVRLEQRLASVGALGGRDTLELAYVSSTAHARPILSARTKLSSLYFPTTPLSASWKVSLEGVEREVHFGGTSDTSHLAYAWDGVDAAGARAPTGAYHFRATSAGSFAGVLYSAATFGGLPTSPTNVQSPQPLPYRVSTGGYAILHDQSKSPFGAGWGLSELERLHPQPDGTVLWTDGRGAAAVMRPGQARDQKQAFRILGGRAGGIV